MTTTTAIKKEDEIILVVPRAKLFRGERLTFQGTQTDKDIVTSIMLNIDENYSSMRRGSEKEVNTPLSENSELNFDFKQPIPYIVIRRGKEFFVTERLAGGGEARLHGKLSMGAGGHMNPLEDESASFEEVLTVNTMRELEEELDITSANIKIKPIGLINDDTDTVGQVHIGVLGIIDLDIEDTVFIREKEQLAGHWIPLDMLREEDIYNRLENWGKIVVDMM